MTFLFCLLWQQDVERHLRFGHFCSPTRFSLFCWPSVKTENTPHLSKTMGGFAWKLTRICLRMLPSVGFSHSQQYKRVQATWRTVKEDWIWPHLLVIPLFLIQELACTVLINTIFHIIFTPINYIPLAFWILVIAVPIFLVTAQFHSWMAHSSSCNKRNKNGAIPKCALFFCYTTCSCSKSLDNFFPGTQFAVQPA